jgi:hypothetical protein
MKSGKVWVQHLFTFVSQMKNIADWNKNILEYGSIKLA